MKEFFNPIIKFAIWAAIVAAIIYGIIFINRDGEESHVRFMKKHADEVETCRADWMKECMTENLRYRCEVIWAEAKLQCP